MAQRKTVKKTVQKEGLHYTTVAALLICNLATLGLGIILAQMLGGGMGDMARIGALAEVRAVHAQTRIMVKQAKNGEQNPSPLPIPVCDARWDVCSLSCDERYDEGLMTSAGWRACERDCDLMALMCEKTGSWPSEIRLRDQSFGL